MKTIYIDTSVFGGNFDEEFSHWNQKFFDKVLESKYVLIYSDVAERELEGAPEKVRKFVDTIPKKCMRKVKLTKEAISLSQKYIDEKVVGKTSRTDCFHIALATILKCDILVRWNFKHIVNLQRINGYNAVNLLHGYQYLEIRNPREVFSYDNKD